jgi:HEAT repeat protein
MAGTSAFSEAAAPLLTALRKEGLPTEGFGDFRSQQGSRALGDAEAFDYGRSVPVLLEWLPRIADRRVKEAIVRSLSTKHARGVAAPMLIEEFKKAKGDPLGLQWTIGNALEVVGDRSVFSELAALAKDRSYGRGREMVVVALATTGHPDAPGELVKLLEDDEVAGHAVLALRRLAPIEARSHIERFVHDQRAWVRREAKVALGRIDKNASTG